MLLSLLISSFFLNNAQADMTKMLEVKKNCRQEIMEKSLLFDRNKSMILPNDRAENLIEDPAQMIKNISVMDEQKLLKKKLTTVPWSDSYWPIYQGELGNRYGDRRFRFSSWKDAHNYVLANPAEELIKRDRIDDLSPSEKYDYLMGLSNTTLTKASWAEGEQYYRETGDVETWMGLCHGWSAASIMMPDPKRKVELNINNHNVVFYPSDIKSYGTLLWAKGNFASKFIGGRCNIKNPPHDDMGRPNEKDCLDNNPGTWHLAVVNQIGVFDRSFVMDATYDYQVWNQPVAGYEYSYYNPKNESEEEKLSAAIVKLADFTEDARRSVRAREAKYIVGIIMHVSYVSENSPSKEEFQSSHFASLELRYDLELDEKMNIVGGEWYSLNHPDFLWVPQKDAYPQTYGDNPSRELDLLHLGSEVKKAAGVNARYGLPSGNVVRAMFLESSVE